MHFDLGGGYCLRPFLYGDAESIAKHGNNPNIACVLRDSFPSPYKFEDAQTWIRYVKTKEADKRFAIAYKQDAIGEIGIGINIDVHRFSAEIGYWLSEEHWGKGLMSQALNFMTKYSFYKFNLTRLYADVTEQNNVSAVILVKCGYTLEATFRKHIYKNGKFYNQLVYGITASDIKEKFQP